MSVHQATVYMVECDGGCQETLDTMFDAEPQDWELEPYGWTTEGRDKHYCGFCDSQRSCARSGHEIRRGATSCRCGSASRAVVTAPDPTLRMETG